MININNYLIHHGILGMKWGKKKHQDDNNEKPRRLNSMDKSLKIGIMIAGSFLTAYGSYKIGQFATGKGSSMLFKMATKLDNQKLSDVIGPQLVDKLGNVITDPAILSKYGL